LERRKAMRRVNYKIQEESIDDMQMAGEFNPCSEITFRDKSGIHTHKIEAGNRGKEKRNAYKRSDRRGVWE